MDNTHIGFIIKARRVELGMSQTELAKKVGYTADSSKSTIAKIEQGLRDVSRSKIPLFAEALHLSIAELLGLEEAPTNQTFILVGQRIKKRREELNISVEELSTKIGKSKTTIYRYELGLVDKATTTVLKDIANALFTTPAYLMGWEEQPENTDIFKYNNIKPIATKKIPMLGRVACGKPIFADEQRDYYIEVGVDINADFVLTASGDSMTGAKINDGDLIFCKSQPTVNNGEIAVVIIGDEATLKRVYYYPEKQKLVLQAENPKYEPFVYVGEELQDIRIIGKALVLQTNIK